MFLCFRVDLDYVPWDTPDASDFGHGEPAMILKLLELARETKFQFHFFASYRQLQAFPTAAQLILDEGHDLDWLCKHPLQAQARLDECLAAFQAINHQPIGTAAKETWMEDAPVPEQTSQFLTAKQGPKPPKVPFFPVLYKTPKEAYKSGVTSHQWLSDLKVQLRDHASRRVPITISLRPQTLKKFDPQLAIVKEALTFSHAIGLQVITLRQAISLDIRQTQD